jgi:hypothetical protein
MQQFIYHGHEEKQIILCSDTMYVTTTEFQTLAIYTRINNVPDLMVTDFGMLRFYINSTPGRLWHVGSVAHISMVRATMEMETACTSKTLAKVPTSTQCKHPQAKLISTISYCESLISVMLRLGKKKLISLDTRILKSYTSNSHVTLSNMYHH